MKYRNVFLIWLWANLILISATIILINVHYYMKGGTNNGLYENMGKTIILGFLFTIPSLIIMLAFQKFYSNNKFQVNADLKPYCIVILCINGAYLIIFKIIFGFDRIWGGPIKLPIIFLLTTSAGLIGLYIEHKKIKKRIIN